MRPVILCCPARNELHNITRMLPAWCLYADYIVVADQMSFDGSREFLAQFDKVHVIDNLDQGYNEKNRIKLLVEKARSLHGKAVLVFVDADETLSANVVESLEWKSFLQAPPGTAGFFRWAQLWGSIGRYIARGLYGLPVHQPFAFVDDGREVGEPGIQEMHGIRGPGLGRPSSRFYFDQVVILHFFLTNRDVYRKKQNWYRLYWLRRGGKYFHTNRNHSFFENVTVEQTDLSPPEWWRGFQDKKIDLWSAWAPELLWYDVEILQYMNINGDRKLWLLDIWNQDWDYLRHLAIEAGHQDIPQRAIAPPPDWIARYTDWTLGRSNGWRALHAIGRYAKRRLLP